MFSTLDCSRWRKIDPQEEPVTFHRVGWKDHQDDWRARGWPWVVAILIYRKSKHLFFYNNSYLCVLIATMGVLFEDFVTCHTLSTNNGLLICVLCSLYFTWTNFALKVNNNSLLSKFHRYHSTPSYYIWLREARGMLTGSASCVRVWWC